MDIHIREATLEEGGLIASLIQELARGEGEHSPISETYVAEYLAFPGSKVLLAEQDGQVVGLLSYSIRPNLYHASSSCLIEEFVVRQRARGQGVGGALMEEAIKRAIDAGCAEISVSTMLDNQKAIAFYRKYGFTDEALFLEKHLEERVEDRG